MRLAPLDADFGFAWLERRIGTIDSNPR